MSTGFIVNAPTPDPEETPINGGPFWPRIEPSKMRDTQRIDNAVTPDRLRMALIEAIATTNAALRTLRIDATDRGIATLADIDADRIDDDSVLVHRYRRAVGSLAKALLLERTRDFDTTQTSRTDQPLSTLNDTIDDCRRDHRNAIADLLGVSRVTVELI